MIWKVFLTFVVCLCLCNVLRGMSSYKTKQVDAFKGYINTEILYLLDPDHKKFKAFNDTSTLSPILEETIETKETACNLSQFYKCDHSLIDEQGKWADINTASFTTSDQITIKKNISLWCQVIKRNNLTGKFAAFMLSLEKDSFDELLKDNIVKDANELLNYVYTITKEYMDAKPIRERVSQYRQGMSVIKYAALKVVMTSLCSYHSRFKRYFFGSETDLALFFSLQPMYEFQQYYRKKKQNVTDCWLSDIIIKNNKLTHTRTLRTIKAALLIGPFVWENNLIRNTKHTYRR